jgi:hypothetical protein
MSSFSSFFKDLFKPPEEQLGNVTEHFLNFLTLDNTVSRVGQEFSYMSLISGDTGEGKSTLENILLSKHFEINPRRYAVFFKGQESTLKEYRQMAPQFADRFYIIDHLLDVKELPLPSPMVPEREFVFVADEGGLDMSGKEALKIEMRSLIKMFKKSRHYKCISYVLDQTKSVLKDYRSMCHIRMYKALNDEYFIEQNDPWAKKFQKKITNLLEDETVIKSKYKYFTGLSNERLFELLATPSEDRAERHRLKEARIHRGFLVLDAMKHAPWALNENISQNLKHESLDHDYEKQKRVEVKINQLAETVANKFGGDLTKAKSFNVMQGWLKREYPKEAYILAQKLRDIYDSALLLLYDKGELYKAKNTQVPTAPQLGASQPPPLIAPVDNAISYAEYIKQVVGQVDPTWGEICYFWAIGVSLRDTADNLNISKNSIQPFIKQFQEGGLQDREDLRSGYLFEDWFALAHGGDLRGQSAHNDRVPDFIDKQGRIFQLKCQTGSKSEKTKRYEVPKDCQAEYDEAVRQGKTFFFVHHDVKWGEEPLIKEIDPKRMEPAVVFYKPKAAVKTVFRKGGAVGAQPVPTYLTQAGAVGSEEAEADPSDPSSEDEPDE